MRAIQVLLLIWRIETKISSDGMSQPVISKGGMHKLFYASIPKQWVSKGRDDYREYVRTILAVPRLGALVCVQVVEFKAGGGHAARP